MKEFIEAPKIIYQKAKRDKRLIENKSLKQLKELALKQNGESCNWWDILNFARTFFERN